MADLSDDRSINRSAPFQSLASDAIAVVLALVVFAADTFTGYESAVAVLYALVILIAARDGPERKVLLAAAGSVALAVASFLLTHAHDIDTGTVGRLAVALFAIGMTGALLLSQLSARRAQAAFQASEANLRLIADSVPQVLWQGLPDGRLTFLNRRWDETTGVPVDVALADGWAWLNGFHPDDRDGLLDDWATARASGEPFESYRRLRRKDGTDRWMQISGRPVWSDDGGGIVQWYGVLTDIDDEMRAQLTARALNQTLEQRVAERTDDLIRSEQRYRSIFEQSHVAMFEWDLSELDRQLDRLRREGVRDLGAYLMDRPDILAAFHDLYTITDANEAAVKLLDVASRADLVGRPGPMRKGSANTLGGLVAAYEGRTGYTASEEFVLHDGRVVKVLYGVSYIMAAADRRHALVGMIDVTDREEAQELLIKAKEDLARANRAATVGAFSATIAHELNQPIGALMMDAQTTARWLDRDEPDLASARRALTRLVANAERASHVLRRTREQLTKGRRAVIPLDIGSVVVSAVDLLQRELQMSRVRVDLALASALPAVEADRVELQQVIINLVMNAVHAMAGTAPIDRVIAISTARDGDRLVARFGERPWHRDRNRRP